MGAPLKVALIGTGFMGKAHALAWRNLRAVMGGARGGSVDPVQHPAIARRRLRFAGGTRVSV